MLLCLAAQSCLTLCDPWTAARQCSRSFTISRSLLRLIFIESLMPSKSHPLSPLLLLPSVFPSIRVFSSESAFHSRWPNCWSLSFSVSASSECSGLISSALSLVNSWLDRICTQPWGKRARETLCRSCSPRTLVQGRRPPCRVSRAVPGAGQAPMALTGISEWSEGGQRQSQLPNSFLQSELEPAPLLKGKVRHEILK